MPRTEMTGTEAFRSPWRHMARPKEEPSARAVRR